MSRPLTRTALALAAAAVVTLSGGAAATAAVAAGAADAGTSTASSAARPPTVHLRPFGQVWRFDSVQVALDVRCAPGAVVQDLTVEVDLGDYHASRSGPVDATCDGTAHLLTVIARSGGPDAVSGQADVTASLTVGDGGPSTVVTDAASVYLRPVAVIRVGDVRVNASGTAVVEVSMRCETPWVSQGLGVEVRQHRGRVGGYGSALDNACDSTWHVYRVRVTPNLPWSPGKARVSTAASFLDPWDFDPVGGAGTTVWRTLTPWGGG